MKTYKLIQKIFILATIFFNYILNKNEQMMEQKQIFFLLFLFLFLVHRIINHVLLPFGLISLILRQGGNDCLTFSAFSLSGTITKK